MLFRRKRREVPGLNTSSTADISFMLLIFFLVTTSMDTDKGMGAVLPPLEPERQEHMDIDRSKVLKVHLLEGGEITVGDDSTRYSMSPQFRRKVKEFIVKVGPSHIIDVQTDGNCDYDTYFSAQNEIIRSYREIREAAAKQRYGKGYSLCNEEQQQAIDGDFPQRIHETY